jgi:hypothetical protein
MKMAQSLGGIPALRHVAHSWSFERHALKYQARQPNPDPDGTLQPAEEAITETVLSAGCPQTGQATAVSCFLSSFSKVFAQSSHRYSNRGMFYLHKLLISIYSVFTIYSRHKFNFLKRQAL